MAPRPLALIDSISDNYPNSSEGNEFYSSEYLVATLRVLYEELGRAPTADDIRNLSEKLPDVSTYERRFGSWIKALEAAGIEGCHNRSDETIIRQLAELAMRLGRRRPTKREVDSNPDVASSGLYTNRFGRFSYAVDEAMRVLEGM